MLSFLSQPCPGLSNPEAMPQRSSPTFSSSRPASSVTARPSRHVTLGQPSPARSVMYARGFQPARVPASRGVLQITNAAENTSQLYEGVTDYGKILFRSVFVYPWTMAVVPWRPLAAMGLWSVAISAALAHLPDAFSPQFLKGMTTCHQLLGASLGFLLALRLSQGFGRWWSCSTYVKQFYLQLGEHSHSCWLAFAGTFGR